MIPLVLALLRRQRVFLMALCVDYNLFLASRAAREETVGGST